MTDTRSYDIVLFGATGFTGELIAEYLAGSVEEPVRWAIAGRNLEKLAALKDRLSARYPAVASIGMIEADNRNWGSLVFMARQARVVLTTVGPYLNGGDQLVHACITGGADYVDITGEPDFVNDSVARFDDKAREKGVRIVHCCGFDSIPHDLGVFYTVQQLPADQPITVEGFVQANGALSGGTWQTAIKAMSRGSELGRQAATERKAGEDDSLRRGRRVRGLKPRVGYRRDVRGWVFPLPTIDPQIVLHSARLIDRYGPDFRYAHYGKTRSLVRLAAGAAGVLALVLLSQWGPTRAKLLEYRKSGEGPSPEKRARSWFRVTFVGKAGDARVVTRVSGGDPGYTETAKMAAESALCLARDRDRLPERSGVLTPAAAMGQPLLERLQRAGIRFEVVQG